MVDLGVAGPRRGHPDRRRDGRRSRGRSPHDLAAVIKDLDARGYRPRVLFLEASRRGAGPPVRANRRAHPLQGDGRLADGIAAERALLAPLRRGGRPRRRHLRRCRCHQLRAERSSARSARTSAHGTRVTVVSFGYKYGLPLDADLVVDVRFLPNPFWIPELRDHTGRDQASRDYVLSQEGAEEFLDRYLELLRPGRRRLPARGQALPDARGRLHRRQAPQRRDRRGARAGGSQGDAAGRSASSTATWGASE